MAQQYVDYCLGLRIKADSSLRWASEIPKVYRDLFLYGIASLVQCESRAHKTRQCRRNRIKCYILNHTCSIV